MRRRRLLQLLLGLLPLGGLGRSARYYAIERIKHDFVAAVAATNERARSRMPSVFVLDVGTNTGAFSQTMMEQLHRAAPRTDAKLIMFEPQPQFASRLGALAAQWRGTHLAAAAWTAEANLTFFLNSNSAARRCKGAFFSSSRSSFSTCRTNRA